MAGRNQVTADLRISANAELQNSRAFINKLDKIIDGFDFGDKMNKQLLSAQDQLKNLNKILEKVQNKSVISDNELKELVKAGKEISNIVNKTEKLYSNFNDSDWKRYSKEYIAQVEKQQKEIAKIKEKYSKETGGNFDKDLANLDKYKQKVNDLSKEIKALNTSKDSRIQDRIDEENKALQEQFEILQKVKRVEEERKTKRQNAIDNYNQNNIAIASSDGKVKVTKESTRRDMANNEYQKMTTTFTEVSKKRQEILDSGKSEKQIQKELVALAKQYGIQSVKNTEQFDKQLKVLQEQKNFYKLLKNRDQLVTEQAVTEEYEKRLRLAQELENIDKKIYSDNGINSEKDLKIQKRRAESALDSSRVEVTGTGASLTKQAEDDIANEIVSATTEQTNKLTQEMTDTRSIIEQISQYAAKLATQSERENKDSSTDQILKSVEEVSNSTDEVEGKVNDYTSKDNDRIANNIIKLGINSSIPYGKEFIDTARNVVAVEDSDWQEFDINALAYENLSSSLENEIEDIKAGVGEVSKARELVKEVSETFEYIENRVEKGFSELIEDARKELESGKITEEQYDKRIEDIGHKQSTFRQRTNVMANRIDTQSQVLNPEHTVDPEILGEVGKKAEESARGLAKAAEQSQYLGSAFDDIKNKIGYFLSLNYLFDQITRKISEAVATTREMDKDMTQIGLVLGKTSGQVWRNFDSYSKMADRLNTTTSQVVNSMKLFYQQGLNTSEVNKMVEASAIAAALGESSMAEASETLTSILNSYNLSANEAMAVTDKISQIAIVSAADFGELSTAIEKVASSAASAGLDLDHMMGYLAKMIETTREAPTNIGTALKTIVANFTQFKEDPTQLNVEGSDINKVDKALKSVGISLTDTRGEVRDLSDVLDELGGKWNSLTRSQKSYLATQIAGTRQQSRFYALMNDYERTLELVEEGSNSSGKAQQQFGLYTESLESSTNRLNNEWEKFFNQITSGNGLIKNTTDILTQLMKIVNAIGPLNTVLGLGAFFKELRKASAEIDNFGNNIEKVLEVKDAPDKLKDFNKRIEEIKNNSNLSREDKTKAIIKENEGMSEYLNENSLSLDILKNSEDITKIADIKKNINDVNTKLNLTTKLTDKIKLSGKKAGLQIQKGMTTAKVAVQALGKAMAQAAVQAIAMYAITKVIQVIGMAWDAATTSAEEYREMAEQNNENASNIKSLKIEYEELSKKVNKTAEEQKRLKEITEEVTKIDAQLGAQLKNNANAYQTNIKAMEDYIKLQQKMMGQNAAQAILKENGGWNSFWDSLLGEGFWAQTFDLFGNSENENKLKQTRFQTWRNLSNSRAQEAGLDDIEQQMLNLYTENTISKNQNLLSTQIMNNVDDFDKLVKDFIDKLQNMTKEEKKIYTDLQNFAADEKNSLSDYYDKIEESNLPTEIKEQLKKNAEQVIADTYNNLNNNNFISNPNEVAKGLIGKLNTEQLSRLLNIDLSDLSEQEQTNYKNDFSKLVSSENIGAFTKALKAGGSIYRNYIDNLVKLGQITDATAEKLLNFQKSIDTAKEASEGLTNFVEIVEETIKTGKISQEDILQKLIEDKIKIGDINVYTSVASPNPTTTGMNYQTSFMTIDTKSLVSQAMASIQQTLAPLEKTKNTLNTQYENHKLIPQQQYEAVKREEDAARNKRDNIQNQLDEAKARQDKASVLYNAREATQIRNDKVEGGKTSTSWAAEIFNALNPVRIGMDIGATMQGIDVVGDYKNATNDVENYQKQLDEANEELKQAEQNTKNAEKATKDLADTSTKAGKAFKEEEDYLKEQAEEAENTYDAMKKLMELDIKPMADFSAVFDQFQVMGQVDQELDSLQQAWDMVASGAQNYRSVASMIAADPSLINAIDMEAEHLQFSDEALEAHAKNVLQTEMKSVDAKIKGTEAIIACLEGQTEGSDAWKTATNEDIASAMAYNNSWVKNEQEATDDTKAELETSSQQYADWGNSVQQAYQAVEKARSQYIKGLNSESETNYLESITNLKGVTLAGSNSDAPTVDKNDIEATKKQILGDAAGDSAKTKEIIGKYKNQLAILKKLKGDLQADINNPAGLFKRNSKNGGSKDKTFDPLIEKLDHFYNYLRKIEKLEAKINRLREERNLIDTSKNYYIDNLIEENKLLAEQQDLYSNYIRDEGEYLTELRGELTKKFNKWVTFDKEGVVQVKQTEFKLNTEKQKEEYEDFSELLGLYQDEYNTREENITKLTEAQVQQVENIAAAYEKVLERVTDINEAIQKQIDLLDHDITMSFSNIAKFDIFDTQMNKAVKGIREMFGFVSEYQTQIDKINKQVSSGPFKELFRWDEDLGFYRSNDKLLEDSNTQKKYEKMGYNWAQIHTYVKSTAEASEQLSNSWEEANNNANSFAETLKTLLQDSIDNFTSLVSAAGDELNKIFDTFDKKMTRIDNESNLFGVVSENLEDKYLTLVTATATLKQTIELLNNKRATILDTIKEQYSEFVDEINGYTVINKQAIEESDELSEGQKAQLLSWYEAFNAYDELIGESEDRLVDYFNQILEMENEKRDAIINLKQSIHDELMARDQEEIDNLREKYEKMSQLDNEYYNKLTDKVNKARQLREDRQADANIPQTQARLAVLKTDNGGTRNSELIELQKQLNEQLQSQADRDVDRELERIQREQQEREEDRQLTISAMENVLTFKDDNNWYWQEAQRIWSEGPESVTGFLRTSNEYMNISDEQRAQLFEELDNSINTAFATLQTAAGITAGISDGIVRDKSDEEQAKLDNVNNNLGFIQTQLGQEGLAGKIDWANAENAKHLLEIQTNADGNALKITTKLQDLYTTKIGPGVDNLQNTIVTYLGKNSEIWQKLGMIDATTGTVNTSVTTGFTNLSSTITTALETLGTTLNSAWDAFKEKSLKVLDYLIKEHGLENKIEPDKNDVKLPQTPVEPTKGTPPKQTSTVKTDNSSNGGGNKTLKVGGGATAKSSAKIYSSYAGGSGSGQYYAKDPNYKVLQLRGNRALVRYHKLSSGYTGWFNKTDLTPYRKGGYVDYTGIAAVHGSKNSPEAFLSAKQTKLFEVLRDSLVNASNNKNYTKEEKEANNTGYQIDNVNIEVKELADVDSVEKMTRKVKEEIYKDATGRNNMAVRRR